MKRIFLFLATNLAIIFVLTIVLQIFGVERLLYEQGTDIPITYFLVIAAVFGFGGSFISLAISKWIAKRSTGARVIEKPGNETEMWLLNTVRQQARRAGIGMPEVAVFDSPEMNAFATGMWRNKALVAVSTGLLNSMERGEVEAVLGHEISHIANGDMITMTLLMGILNTFVFFLSRVIGFVVDKVVFRSRGFGIGYFITVIVMQIILTILASTIVMWFSRKREFHADAGGAKLAGREKMIAALERLKGDAGETVMPKQMAAFGISGKRSSGFRRLFMSHPPLEERIATLQRNPVN
ncbi:MAG: protease HtpX [Gammaproteobacteria bacterium]|nr:MAG: protease HtpX [Gammaproteobacteria bacterium]